MGTRRNLASNMCIYRVPFRIRRQQPMAYTPEVVSIGPLHHGDERLKSMERHKSLYVQDYLRVTKLSRKRCENMVKRQEQRLRSCYSDEETMMQLSSEQFTNIILVDAIFIIEYFLKFNGYEVLQPNDRIHSRPWLFLDILDDLMLIENQLPLFIVELLYAPLKSILFPPSSRETNISFLQLVSQPLADYVKWLKITDVKLQEIISMQVEHFVHFMLCAQTPLHEMQGGPLNNWTTPSMSELHQAGVKFKVSSVTSDIWDVEFANGILRLPKLVLNSTAERTIRNLLAFEQCHFQKCYLSEYVVFLGGLVNTSKDADLLVQNGIVETTLSDSNFLSNMINNLPKGVFLDLQDFCFASVCDSIDNYCKTPWNKWKANLRQKYFHTPSSIINFIAVAITIVLTFIQAIPVITNLSNEIIKTLID